MKLILTDDDGAVLDTTDISREEWELSQKSVLTAGRILQSLQAGKDAK